SRERREGSARESEGGDGPMHKDLLRAPNASVREPPWDAGVAGGIQAGAGRVRRPTRGDLGFTFPCPGEPHGDRVARTLPRGQSYAMVSLPILQPSAERGPKRHPPWLRVRAPGGERYRELKQLLEERRLH